jgi:hypothetical protein
MLAIARGFAAFAAAAMAGGLLVLGAVVAPRVFGAVPAPLAGDTMAGIFAAFDRLSLGIAAYIALTESVAAVVTRRQARASWWWVMLTAVGMVGLVLLRVFWLTPGIAALHAAHAVRHVGELGARMETLHQLSKRFGTLEVLLCAAYVLTHFRGYKLSETGRKRG